MPPLVSIVTLNWNQAETTCDLLASLGRITYPNVEVIVVDNGSAPADFAHLSAFYPKPRILRSPTNLGFTGGNNLGMRAARGQYVLLLNNDTEVAPDFLEPLVAAMEADPAIGAASPKILYFDEPDRIQYAGGTAVNERTAQARWIGSGEIDRGQHDQSGPTEMGHGAALLIRRQVLEEVGLLGADFFACYEELDFGTRLCAAGWGLHYAAESVVWHKESVSMGKQSPLKAYFQARNRLLYLRRNLPRPARRKALFWIGCVVEPARAARFLLRGQLTHAWAVLRGLAWHVEGRPLTPDERLGPLPSSQPVLHHAQRSTPARLALQVAA
jgi:GT2 family glycosyltransferase